MTCLHKCAAAARTGGCEAIGRVKDADAVILVEEKRVSRMEGIIRAAELLQIAGADVQGSVIL